MTTYQWDLLDIFRLLILERVVSASVFPHFTSKGPYASAIPRDLVFLEIVSHCYSARRLGLRRKAYLAAGFLAGTFRRTLAAGTRELRLAARGHRSIHDDFVWAFVLERLLSIVEDLMERVDGF